MGKLTIEELSAIRDRSQQGTSLRQGTARVRITVHMGTCGIAAGAREIMGTVIAEVERHGLRDVAITNSGCAGLCSQEPMITVERADGPAPVKYVKMTAAKVAVVVEGHVVGGRPVAEYALAIGSERTR